MITETAKGATSQTQHYEIRFTGHLDPRWSDWFEGMMMVRTETGDTILSGSIVVQSALHGLLSKIQDMNLTLVSVNRK